MIQISILIEVRCSYEYDSHLGATLYDFYFFRRLYEIPNLRTLSTGSKLAAHMKAIGELDWADHELHWASQEADPVEVPPCDIGELIKSTELLVRKGVWGQPVKRPEGQEPTQPTGAPETTGKSSVISVFDQSNYPPPWPLIPFSSRNHKLQKRIPFHLLPQKLVVHDPWNLLSVDRRDIRKYSDAVEWGSKDDITRTYYLQLSESGTEVAEKEKKLRADLVAKCNDIGEREGYRNTLDPTKTGPVSPMVMAYPPLCPPPPESVPEAHLYLSPAHHVGTGNHSVVYNAEWELPRSMLVKDILCQKCMQEKVAEELKEMEKRGEYDPNEVAIGGKPEGNFSGQPSQHKSAKVTTTTEKFPAISAEIVVKDGGGPPVMYTIDPPQIIHTATYEGPVVKVFPDVHWQNPERGPYCSHIQESQGCEKVPLTAQASVVAKLSRQHDSHLAQEAENYQSFPTHFFEHWSGYNILPPLHDPVPVGALVPQFYGYYVPEKNQGDESSPYLSPILLLENCGIPIDAALLNRDEKQECASLLYRLQEAGWNHGSFYERNILMQSGPLSEWPLARFVSGVKSFRLIDFGRSAEFDSSNSRAHEESYADRLFNISGCYPHKT